MPNARGRSEGKVALSLLTVAEDCRARRQFGHRIFSQVRLVGHPYDIALLGHEFLCNTPLRSQRGSLPTWSGASSSDGRRRYAYPGIEPWGPSEVDYYGLAPFPTATHLFYGGRLSGRWGVHTPLGLFVVSARRGPVPGASASLCRALAREVQFWGRSSPGFPFLLGTSCDRCRRNFRGRIRHSGLQVPGLRGVPVRGVEVAAFWAFAERVPVLCLSSGRDGPLSTLGRSFYSPIVPYSEPLLA